jgi:hypothetical protein
MIPAVERRKTINALDCTATVALFCASYFFTKHHQGNEIVRSIYSILVGESKRREMDKDIDGD